MIAGNGSSPAAPTRAAAARRSWSPRSHPRVTRRSSSTCTCRSRSACAVLQGRFSTPPDRRPRRAARHPASRSRAPRSTIMSRRRHRQRSFWPLVRRQHLDVPGVVADVHIAFPPVDQEHRNQHEGQTPGRRLASRRCRLLSPPSPICYPDFRRDEFNGSPTPLTTNSQRRLPGRDAAGRRNAAGPKVNFGELGYSMGCAFR